MSLIDAMMEKCVIVDKVSVSDGEGGFTTEWHDGATINAAIVHNSSMEAQIAEKQGVTSTYTVTTSRAIQLEYHTVLRRVADGKLFRTTSNPWDIKSPEVSTLDIAQVTAERWELPT